MTKSKAIIDAVVESEESTRKRMPYGYVWRNAHGVIHRLDGPAVEWDSGNKEWFVDGKLHRDDGPARTWVSGSDEWWLNGKLHREDAPAVVMPYADQWWLNGKLHRLDGPAKEWVYGRQEWWVNGRQFTEEEFDLYVDQENGEVLIPPGKKLYYDKK